MTVVATLLNDRTHYEVDHVDNYNDFLKWLRELEEIDISICTFGYCYHFRTYEERMQYIFGFQSAWELAYNNKLPICEKETI